MGLHALISLYMLLFCQEQILQTKESLSENREAMKRKFEVMFEAENLWCESSECVNKFSMRF